MYDYWKVFVIIIKFKNRSGKLFLFFLTVIKMETYALPPSLLSVLYMYSYTKLSPFPPHNILYSPTLLTPVRMTGMRTINNLKNVLLRPWYNGSMIYYLAIKLVGLASFLAGKRIMQNIFILIFINGSITNTSFFSAIISSIPNFNVVFS